MLNSSVLLAHLKIRIMALHHLLWWLIKAFLCNWRRQDKGEDGNRRSCCKPSCSSIQKCRIQLASAFSYVFSGYIFSHQSPTSVRCLKDGAHLMSSQITLCFPVFVQCVALGLIDNTLFKSCSEDGIIDFLIVFSFFFYHGSNWVLVIVEPKCFTNINLSLQHPWEERAALGSLLIQRGWQWAQIEIRSIQQFQKPN